jgi:hypothetical protein
MSESGLPAGPSCLPGCDAGEIHPREDAELAEDRPQVESHRVQAAQPVVGRARPHRMRQVNDFLAVRSSPGSLARRPAVSGACSQY